MFLARDLFLKGLTGASALGGISYGGYYYSGQIRTFIKDNIFPETEGGLLKMVGIYCSNWREATNTKGVECSRSKGALGINVVEETGKTFEVSNIPSSTGGRIWLYKANEDEGYKKNLKFVIEGGDIGSSTSGKKLEEFETYEIKELAESKGVENKYVLSRKKKSSEEKARILGLGGCKFPESETPTSSCPISDASINNIQFYEKDTSSTLSGNITLEVSKSPSPLYFPHGFKFKLTSTSGEITINNRAEDPIVLKGSKPEEFRIRKEGKSLTLERAWNLETLTQKIKLSCGNGTLSEESAILCTKAITDDKIKVKQDKDTSIEVSSIPANAGKIKLYRAQATEGYFKDLKFVIEESNITATPTGKKLEEFETYEIKEDTKTNKWYLTRRKKSGEEKSRLLGFPQDKSCIFPETAGTPVTCTLNTNEKINGIKFEGKSNVQITGTANLKIEVVQSNDAEYFPLGYKFTLTATGGGNLTINRNQGDSIVLSANQSEEFKIKKTNSKTLTLEEAWNKDSLGKKVGLSCRGTPSESTGIDCTKIGNNNVKVKKDSDPFDIDSIDQGKKIKLYKVQGSEGYFKNLKFVIEDGDIGTGNNKLEQFETYEIKKDNDGNYYLTRKKEAKEGIKKALGLPEDCDFPSNGNQQDGCDISNEKFKKVKFDGISDSVASASGTPKLKISKVSGDNASEFPFGYKFVLVSDKEAKISGTLTIAKNTNTEFKIKKGTGNGLTLEKAWSVTTLGQKIKLKECTTNKPKECSFGDSISVHDGSNSRKDATIQDKSKKISYEEGQGGYNQGIKFYVSGENEIQLTGGTPNDGSPNKIEKNGTNGTSYEIKEEGGKWYLYKWKESSKG